MVINTDYRLMHVKSIAEFSTLQYFKPSLSNQFFIKIVLSIFEWPFYKDFTVYFFTFLFLGKTKFTFD